MKPLPKTTTTTTFFVPSWLTTLTCAISATVNRAEYSDGESSALVVILKEDLPEGKAKPRRLPRSIVLKRSHPQSDWTVEGISQETYENTLNEFLLKNENFLFTENVVNCTAEEPQKLADLFTTLEFDEITVEEICDHFLLKQFESHTETKVGLLSIAGLPPVSAVELEKASSTTPGWGEW